MQGERPDWFWFTYIRFVNKFLNLCIVLIPKMEGARQACKILKKFNEIKKYFKEALT